MENDHREAANGPDLFMVTRERALKQPAELKSDPLELRSIDERLRKLQELHNRKAS